VLLTSGYNEQEAIGAFAGKGLAGFIQKPYTPSELLERVRSVLDAAEATR
jgi:DNA-binding response OmpR family regulator